MPRHLLYRALLRRRGVRASVAARVRAAVVPDEFPSPQRRFGAVGLIFTRDVSHRSSTSSSRSSPRSPRTPAHHARARDRRVRPPPPSSSSPRRSRPRLPAAPLAGRAAGQARLRLDDREGELHRRAHVLTVLAIGSAACARPAPRQEPGRCPAPKKGRVDPRRRRRPPPPCRRPALRRPELERHDAKGAAPIRRRPPLLFRRFRRRASRAPRCGDRRTLPAGPSRPRGPPPTPPPPRPVAPARPAPRSILRCTPERARPANCRHAGPHDPRAHVERRRGAERELYARDTLARRGRVGRRGAPVASHATPVRAPRGVRPSRTGRRLRLSGPSSDFMLKWMLPPPRRRPPRALIRTCARSSPASSAAGAGRRRGW